MQMSPAHEVLLQMSVAYEFYVDAYVGEDAPFGDNKPTQDDLCKIIVDLCSAAAAVLREHRQLSEALDQARDALSPGPSSQGPPPRPASPSDHSSSQG